MLVFDAYDKLGVVLCLFGLAWWWAALVGVACSWFLCCGLVFVYLLLVYLLLSSFDLGLFAISGLFGWLFYGLLWVVLV